VKPEMVSTHAHAPVFQDSGMSGTLDEGVSATCLREGQEVWEECVVACQGMTEQLTKSEAPKVSFLCSVLTGVAVFLLVLQCSCWCCSVLTRMCSRAKERRPKSG
jgi:hypothetical protein